MFKRIVQNGVAAIIVWVAEELLLNGFGFGTMIGDLMPLFRTALPGVGFMLSVMVITYFYLAYKRWNETKGNIVIKELSEIQHCAENILNKNIDRKISTQFHYQLQRYKKWFPDKNGGMEIENIAQSAASFSVISVWQKILNALIIMNNIRIL